MEELIADLEWLAGDVKKLRGRVTGGLRNKETLQDAPGPTIDGDPRVKGSPAWFAAQRERLGMKRGIA